MRARDQVVESFLHFFVQFISPNGGVGVADEKGHARQVQIIIFFGWKMHKFFFQKKEKKREDGNACESDRTDGDERKERTNQQGGLYTRPM
jgi:hypothetical protein